MRDETEILGDVSPSYILEISKQLITMMALFLPCEEYINLIGS